jgi:hypothetical protein
MLGLNACSTRRSAPDSGSGDVCANMPGPANALREQMSMALSCFTHHGGCLPDGGAGPTCGAAVVDSHDQPHQYQIEWPDGTRAYAWLAPGGGPASFFYGASTPGGSCFDFGCCGFHFCGAAFFSFPDAGFGVGGIGYPPGFCGFPDRVVSGPCPPDCDRGGQIDAGQLLCFETFTYCGVTDAGDCVELTVSLEKFRFPPYF